MKQAEQNNIIWGPAVQTAISKNKQYQPAG